MKKKGITYLLICMVAVLWGLIFYRVFAKGGESDEILTRKSSAKPSYFKLVDHGLDRVPLNLDYDDPFSVAQAGSSSSVNNDLLTVRESQSMAPPIKPVVNWPTVVYAGAIYNPTTKKVIAILNINGKEVMVGQGEQVDGIRFIRQQGDSIRIEHQGLNKYLHLK
ncbi:hypothetical protein EZ449_15375 [Pedobacter frigidisoli]|uniref:Type IV pilus biogenesis n=1 Tax=Pedobacter frigidisoli TaxID=2530455 RepID=A0A4R0P2B7_9SPHI|nr:hypothetical protein [Pedobacter frigidisoli]TCD05844.1 hypothetical protein EZ449_15375 [Pedobacter frigidisoli]